MLRERPALQRGKRERKRLIQKTLIAVRSSIVRVNEPILQIAPAFSDSDVKTSWDKLTVAECADCGAIL